MVGGGGGGKAGVRGLNALYTHICLWHSIPFISHVVYCFFLFLLNEKKSLHTIGKTNNVCKIRHRTVHSQP